MSERAKKVRSFALVALIGVLALPALRAETYLVSSTFAGDTRYAVQKLFDGNDDDLCWAATASNLIQNWQDRWLQNGGTIPAGTPNGMVTQIAYSTDVFATFVNNWTNAGGESYIGMQWWYTDSYTYLADSSELKPGATGGAYWIDLGLDKDEIFSHTDLYNDEMPVEASLFTDWLDDLVGMNYLAALGIFTNAGDAHAIPVWGYEMVDDTLTGIWISDSDSGVESNFLVDVYWDNSFNGWLLGDAHTSNPDVTYTGWFVGDMDMFVLPMVPEPSLVALILGVLVLGRVVLLRRRVRGA
ncbi:hypothetical protein H5P28_08205 [Ruficoccus amylovorans]|uniref:Uncharacterized protein n=1 Tax=Ruficoccus amylovorans TaxID=1804625 RepID=A0A842HCQ1_9BACT|nr:hypothetical protein [Ruficoccus amylovorans]MBC2594243.1 hypothetical protein [Ruficoccus amylovorans]